MILNLPSCYQSDQEDEMESKTQVQESPFCVND